MAHIFEIEITEGNDLNNLSDDEGNGADADAPINVTEIEVSQFVILF